MFLFGILVVFIVKLKDYGPSRPWNRNMKKNKETMN